MRFLPGNYPGHAIVNLPQSAAAWVADTLVTRSMLREADQQGASVYPNDFDVTHTTRDIFRRFGEKSKEEIEEYGVDVFEFGIVGERRNPRCNK